MKTYMKTLIALSGGLDSTYLLYKYLQQRSNEEIHTFYADLSSVKEFNEFPYKDSAKVEKWAQGKILHYFLSEQAIPIQHHVVKLFSFADGDWVTPTVIKAAAEFVNEGGFDKFLFARSWENTTTKTGNTKHQEIWRAITKNPMIWPLQDWNEGRAHALANLPPKLKKYTVPCNKPKQGKDQSIEVCNACAKCHRTKDAQRLLDEGVEPDVVYDYQLRLKAAGPYYGMKIIMNKDYYSSPPDHHRLSKWE